MKRFLLLVSLSVIALAAIPGDSIWQVQTVSSSDANCGGWSNANKGATGTDKSQSGGRAFSSSLSAVSTTALTDSGASFVNTDLGNCVNIAGQGSYFITGFTSSTIVTVDRTLGTFSTTSGHLGDPILSLGHVCNLAVAGNVAYFKADGTFTVTSATGNADAGTCSNTIGASLVGYTSNRAYPNTDAQPTIQLNVSTATMFTSAAGFIVYNFILDGNTQTASKLAASMQLVQSTVKNFNTASTGATAFFNVLMTTNSAATWNGGSAGSLCMTCDAIANTSTPYILANGGAFCVICKARANTGGSTDGFGFTSTGSCYFCVGATSGRDNFHFSGTGISNLLVNTYAEAAVGDGYNIVGANAIKLLLGLGYQGNGTNIVSTATTFTTTAITPSSSAFVSSTNLNTNSTANAGALLRGTGLPAMFPDGTTTNARDMNAAQHADPVNVTVGHASVQ